jgi:hypothetical protein
MVIRESSSYHTLNSDFKLPFLNKYLYLFVNAILGFIPVWPSKNLPINKFIPSLEMSERVASQQVSAVSPGRFLSDVFWESLDYKSLNSVLRDQLRVLELGCGSGVYGERISNLYDISSYTGVDIQSNQNWFELDSKLFEFRKDTYENFDLIATNQNLIITQSALEHFEKDLTLFQMINSYASSREFPVVSIHLMPSASSLYTFLWHGIRQYGRLHLKRIRSKSSNSSRFQVYTLGGFPLNWFHFRRITLPQIFSKSPLISSDKEKYFVSLLAAAKLDSKKSSARFSVFTAIVILWNANDPDESIVPNQ